MTPPAAVVEKMAEALLESANLTDEHVSCICNPKETVQAILEAAAEAGWALVAKADVEKAAKVIDVMDATLADESNGITIHYELSGRLRSALGNGGAS